MSDGIEEVVTERECKTKLDSRDNERAKRQCLDTLDELWETLTTGQIGYGSARYVWVGNMDPYNDNKVHTWSSIE